MSEVEFTGTYYKCKDCDYVWDYNDFNCPDCGTEEFEDVNIHEELEIAKEREKRAIYRVLNLTAIIKMHS